MNSNKKETFTRSDIESLLKKEFPNLSKLEISMAIDVFIQTITESVALDEKVEIRGFGSFTTRNINARKGRNPNSGEKLIIPARKYPHFKVAKELRLIVDKN